MTNRAEVIRCLILFAAAFGLHQASNFIFTTNPSLGWLPPLASFIIILSCTFLIKNDGSSFKKHGFTIPLRARRLLTISFFLAVLYVIIVLLVPGGLSGFEALPGVPWSSELFFSGGSILLASIAAEAVFRGYVQTSLTDVFGFSVALITVSVMFTLYMLPITLYLASDFMQLLGQALPFFAASVFLCFFFKEAKTLLCPIAFAATVALLTRFTPLEAMSVEYTNPFMIVTYIVLIPIMQSFMADVKEQNARLEVTEVDDSA